MFPLRSRTSVTSEGTLVFSVLHALPVVLVIGAPLLFWRGVYAPFDVVKATFVWAWAAVTVSVLLVARVRIWRDLPRVGRFGVSALLAASVLSTVTSVRQLESVFGHAGRYTGFLTMWACLVAATTAMWNATRSTPAALIFALRVTTISAASYALLQSFGFDRLDWGTTWSGAFSTMGNPNTAAGVLAVGLPAVAVGVLDVKRPAFRRSLYGVGFGATTVAVSATASFQGPIASVATVILLIAFVAEQPRSRLASAVVLLALVGASAFVAPSAHYLVFACALGGVAGGFQPRRSSVPCGSVAFRRRLAFGLGATLLLIPAGLSSALVRAQIADGFSLRKYLYSASVKMILERPMSGVGFDMFVFESPRHLPTEFFEASGSELASSVHNIPLGMFVSGGVPLGLAYLFFAAAAGAAAVKLIRRADDNRVLYAAIASCWVGFQIQSVVNVDNAALYTLHFVLSGSLIGWAYTRRETADGARQGRSRWRMPVAAALAMASVVVVGLPLRSSLATTAAHSSVRSGEPSDAVSSLNRAVALAPWDGETQTKYAEALALIGEHDQAAEVALLAAAEVRYHPFQAIRLAVIAAPSKSSGALSILEQIEERNPNDPKVSAQVEAIREILVGDGRRAN